MNRSIIFKALFLILSLSPIAEYPAMLNGSVCGPRDRTPTHVKWYKRSQQCWDRILKTIARRQASDAATINKYSILKQLKNPGYIYSSKAGRKRVGMKVVGIHTFIVKFNKKMRCNEFDEYYKYLRQILDESGRSCVFSMLKKCTLEQLKLEIRDTMGVKGFRLVLRKANHRFKNNK